VFWKSDEQERTMGAEGGTGRSYAHSGRINARHIVIAVAVVATGGLIAAAAPQSEVPADRRPLADALLNEQVERGRVLVMSADCGGCHGGYANPAAEGWLAGNAEPEVLGPFKVWARNLTPDDETGLGRFTERQIFNALRYGLRPASTPDVEITSATPGVGNHPEKPDYLAPAMPWVYFRYRSDQELRDMATYLKQGLRPVRNALPPSEGPPDHWAGEFAPDGIGGPALPPFPTAREELRDPARRDQVLRGRYLVSGMACSACHGGALVPVQENWLTGAMGMSPFDEFPIGEFKTYPRNLTPDNSTGMGRFTERQIFNALRFGLRPGETPDVEITSTVPGVGNHPVRPKYMAPPMPWPAWRHLPDEDIRAIAAYLKDGVKPVDNRVPDSEGPPDFWLGEYTEEKYGSWPAPPFPTARERAPTK
jgi:mono/diheme cytochrome c family protein